MVPTNQPWHLQLKSDRSYIAIYDRETEVGFCTPEFASSIIETFNEEEKLREQNETLYKALYMACTDIIRRSGGNVSQVKQVMRKYLEQVKRPEHGSRAIAFLLRDRQRELDVSNQEFARFCDSYRLSPPELLDIYRGKDIGDQQLPAISRIVGKSVKELMEIRDGFTEGDMNRLARILGTSAEELAELFD